MSKADFYQEKMTFLMQYPALDELAFYRFYTKNNPDEAIGWLYLGREWEKLNQPDKALEAYRRAVWAKEADTSSSEDAREAYHRLLRDKKQKKRLQFLRRGIAALLFLTTLFSGLFTQQEDSSISEEQPGPRVASSHTEVIAVPTSMSSQEAAKQVEKYITQRRLYYSKPYTVIAISETDGLPLYTPLLFYQPRQVKGIVQFDPVKKTIIRQKWFDPACACEKDALVTTSKQALAKEQTELAKVLTLRNALFRYYQTTGRLPNKLSELDKPFPQNTVSAIPQFIKRTDNRALTQTKDKTNGMTSQEWPYYPASFRNTDAWNSLRRVVPLLSYPEPMVSLEPLQIYIHQATYSLTLLSGSHIVRRYPIGLGQDQSTPQGFFRISHKINNPIGHDRIYGTRGMLFANTDFAIHGTNKPSSIGKNESLGCVRLHNNDVEELYSFTSLGTEVVISNKKSAPATWSNASPFLLPAGKDEETPGVTYSWLH